MKVCLSSSALVNRNIPTVISHGLRYPNGCREIRLIIKVSWLPFIKWPAYYYKKMNLIEYLSPWEITDIIFQIQKTDDESQTFETIVLILIDKVQ